MNFEQLLDLTREAFVEGARRNFLNDGEVVPVSFLLAQRDPRTGCSLPEPSIIAIPLGHLMSDKDAVREVQQRLCDEADALAHIFVSEGWMVTMDEDKPYEDPYEHGALENHPQRVECVIVCLEHSEGHALWRMPIERDGDNATLGATVETTDGENHGRMSGYIKTARPRRSVPEA